MQHRRLIPLAVLGALLLLGGASAFCGFASFIVQPLTPPKARARVEPEALDPQARVAFVRVEEALANAPIENDRLIEGPALLPVLVGATAELPETLPAIAMQRLQFLIRQQVPVRRANNWRIGYETSIAIGNSKRSSRRQAPTSAPNSMR